MIILFLNNKLISADTFLPVLLEFAERAPDTSIVVVCMSWDARRAIEQNTVIWDAYKKFGGVLCWQRDQKGGESVLSHLLRTVPALFRLLIASIVRRAQIVHFGILRARSLRAFYYFNRARTYLVESNPIGHTELMIERIGNLKRQRSSAPQELFARHVVAFGADWPVARAADAKGIEVLFERPFKQSPSWRRKARSLADEHFSKGDARLKPGERIATFILGSFHRFDFQDETVDPFDIFRETLDVLERTAPGVRIFLKPHIITEMDRVREELAKRASDRYVISYLNPSVLAARSLFFVGNYFSTAFSDARFFHVPTIEYACYSRAALEVTKGGSMRPDYVTHFVQRDPHALQLAVRATLSEKCAVEDSSNEQPSEFVRRLLEGTTIASSGVTP